MKLYFDLDARELVNPPGTGGTLSSVRFVRGDTIPLDVRFLRNGEEVDGITDIVAVIKAAPGETSAALATAQDFTETGTAYTQTLDLNGTDLNELIGTDKSITLLFEINCTASGEGPITAPSISCTIKNDLWRGNEGTPLPLPSPDEWLEARRPAPLALTSPPADDVLQVIQLALSGASAASTGNIIATLTSADLNSGSPITFTVPVTNGDNEYTILGAVKTALEAYSGLTAAISIINIGTLNITRIARGNDSSLVLEITDPSEALTDHGPFTSVTYFSGVEGTTGTALGQLAIVNATGGSTYPKTERDVFVLTCMWPMTWTPPGNLFRDPDTGTWYRHAILPGGGGALDFGYAYD